MLEPNSSKSCLFMIESKSIRKTIWRYSLQISLFLSLDCKCFTPVRCSLLRAPRMITWWGEACSHHRDSKVSWVWETQLWVTPETSLFCVTLAVLVHYTLMLQLRQCPDHHTHSQRRLNQVCSPSGWCCVCFSVKIAAGAVVCVESDIRGDVTIGTALQLTLSVKHWKVPLREKSAIFVYRVMKRMSLIMNYESRPLVPVLWLAGPVLL